VAALLLAALSLPGQRWWRRVLVVGCALTVTLVATMEINAYWGLFPNLHALHDALRPPAAAGAAAPAPTGPVIAAPPGGTLADVWQPPETLPPTGQLSKVHIPGTISRFRARTGYLYLPPAYLVSPRPLLPVVVLLAGQPGSPSHWVSWMHLADVLDGYAKAHLGLAPIALVVDDLGSFWGDPLCVDSPLGNSETYLAKDVPAWIRGHLQVTTDRHGWFIGGYSDGGTCSLQLALRAPAVYGGFVDIAGDRENTFGTRVDTIKRIFGGSAAAFARVNPLDELQHTRFPDTAAFLAAGTDDADSLPGQEQVRAACQGAGIDVAWLETPGGHTLTMWRAAFVQAVPWLGRRGRISEL
jgi:enterochelin esterase-like enzyme